MNFRMLRTGDFVKWNPEIKDKFNEFPDRDRWNGEPLDCLMEVHLARNANMLDCTNGCGSHSVSDITEEEFDEYSKILGKSVLVESSIGEAIGADLDKSFRQIMEKLEEMDEDETKVEAYDPELDIMDFIEEHAPRHVDRLIKS